MEKRADDDLFARVTILAPIARVIAVARERRTDLYLVGGTTRDLMLGRQFVDVDLAVDGDGLELAAAIGSPEPISESRFSTLRISAADARYDLARTRRERYAHPGALPEVEPAPIATDLLRRDFTVNAIALGLTGQDAGMLLAAPRALEDLQRGELAVLHDSSFEDDPTRLMRLARYAARLGFTVAPHTRELATEAIASGALETVSGTRIGNELRLLAAEPDPVAAFEAATGLGLPWTIDAPLARQALNNLPPDGRGDIVVLATVSLGDDLDGLGFSAGDRNAILEARTRSGEVARELEAVKTRSKAARVLSHVGVETIALACAQGDPSQPRLWLDDLRHMALQINGDDLREAGIAEGPAIGRALQAARDAMYDGEATDRESQLAVALKAGQ